MKNGEAHAENCCFRKPTLIYKNTLLYAMGTSVKEIHE
jgi:hypothetical protein